MKTEIESSTPITRARRLWNFLRVAFLMMSKGITGKSRFVIDLNLAMKRGKINGASLGGLLHQSPSVRGHASRHYEFSCTNTPVDDTLFVRPKKRSRRRYLPSIPCINVQKGRNQDVDPDAILVVSRLKFSAENSLSGSADFGEGERISSALSPLPIVVSSCYRLEDDQIHRVGGDPRVDERAEEFITRFYDQLTSQSRMAMLEYEEMLARGR